MPKAEARELKTVLKTVRLTESLVRALEKEAAEEDTSVNADINAILNRHFGWHKKAKEFGFVAVHRPLLISLIEGLDDVTLARIGREVLTSSWEEMAEFWFQDSSPEGLLDALNMASKFDSKMRIGMIQEGDTYTIVFHHDLGRKWSIVAKSAAQKLVKESFHVEPRITAGESVVTARFKVNPRK